MGRVIIGASRPFLQIPGEPARDMSFEGGCCIISEISPAKQNYEQKSKPKASGPVIIGASRPVLQIPGKPAQDMSFEGVVAFIQKH